MNMNQKLAVQPSLFPHTHSTNVCGGRAFCQYSHDPISLEGKVHLKVKKFFHHFFTLNLVCLAQNSSLAPLRGILKLFSKHHFIGRARQTPSFVPVCDWPVSTYITNYFLFHLCSY